MRTVMSRSRNKRQQYSNQPKYRLILIDENFFDFSFTLGVWDCTEKGFSGTPADLFLFSIITGGGLI